MARRLSEIAMSAVEPKVPDLITYWAMVFEWAAYRQQAANGPATLLANSSEPDLTPIKTQAFFR
jgi:hypothetical protein